MAYDYDRIFDEVDNQLSKRPAVHLYELSRNLHCSHPTIEKAILVKTSRPFRIYRQEKLVERVLFLAKTTTSVKEIAFEVGFKWPEHLNRIIKNLTGHTISELRDRSTCPDI